MDFNAYNEAVCRLSERLEYMRTGAKLMQIAAVQDGTPSPEVLENLGRSMQHAIDCIETNMVEILEIVLKDELKESRERIDFKLPNVDQN